MTQVETAARRSNVSLARRAWNIRRKALQMGEVQGQGYVGQALGVADVLAVSYFHALNLRPEDPEWEGRDRFLLSIGHYAIALYAALMEAGVLPEEELQTYGMDDSRMPMSGMAAYTPGMEITGGSLGHGPGIGVGMALGLRAKGNPARVYNLMSDGEPGEGSTWEAAMSAAHHKLSNLICLVDFNDMQADGASTGMLCAEPLAEKWTAFGWFAQRVDGDDIDALVAAFDAARTHAGDQPRVIICDTRMCKGGDFLEAREITHFVRVEPGEWARAFPARFFQMGMAEQRMISAAAGMAREGFIPFATTYAVFAARRAYDFICMAIAEENLPVKIVCALPGLTTGYGPSHQATEDLAIFRGLPNLTIIDPCDAADISGAVPQMLAHDGPVYARLLRGKVPDVIRRHKPDYEFRLGRAQLIREGGDVLVIASGIMTMRALDAAQRLAAEGIEVAVLHSPTIKPLDRETILAEAARARRLVVTAENHTVVGGLGEAVAGVLLQAGVAAPRFRMIGLPDEFLEAGALTTLHEMYGLSVGRVAQAIKGWL